MKGLRFTFMSESSKQPVTPAENQPLPPETTPATTTAGDHVTAAEQAQATPAPAQKQTGQGQMKRRSFLRGCLISSIVTPLSVGALGAGTYYYARNIEPGWIDITHHQMQLAQLGSAFHGYRIVQITDIHADVKFMTEERVIDIVNTVNQLQADIIVITGDFVTTYVPGLTNTLAKLSALRAKDGVFGVLGNHDHPAGVEWVRSGLRQGNVKELPNMTYTLRRGDQMLHLVGMDDLWPENEGTPAPIWSHLSLLNQLTDSLPAEGAAILLVHEPDFADVAASNKRIALQLSGHSHGGQVCIPLHGPIFLPVLCRKYPSGLYNIDNLQLYTNRGLGILELPIRFDCRPEIAVFDLSAA